METADSISFSMQNLLLEARSRWLKPSEILFLLQNVREDRYSQKPPSKPYSGSIYFYNKRVVRNFRQDGHAWRKKKDGKCVNEAHEKLKDGNVHALNCYYAHGEHDPFFQRRSYWQLNSDNNNIVLVHYLYTSEGRHHVSFIAHPGSSNNSTSTNTAGQYYSSENNEECGQYRYCSPGYAAEINSDSSIGNNLVTYPDARNLESTAISSSALALRKIASHLGVVDHDENEENMPGYLSRSSYEAERRNDRSASGHIDVQWSSAGISEKDKTFFDDILEEVSIDENARVALYGGERTPSVVIPQENVIFSSLDDAKCPDDFAAASSCEKTVTSVKKFSITEVSPDWAYSTGNTKVIITGDFLHAPESPWAVMFGDIEVPAEIIQPGVLRCWAPQHHPGNVKLCITLGKYESCSEYGEFTYLAKPESTRCTDELLLLVKFVETILDEFVSADVRVQDAMHPEHARLGKQTTRRDRLDQLLEGVLINSESPSKIMHKLLEEFFRDKLPQWLEQRKLDGKLIDSSSKQELSIIHMLSGLGYEWALKPVLDSGIGINFRDVRGWTALHWAACFGREKMVAALLAAGALAGAVTDPTQQDALGKTPASIAAEYGHKGLSGFLAEGALTSFLSSVTTGESEISRAFANEETNKSVQNISEKTITSNFAETEDQLSLKDSLGAVVNASQAAARIQSAFRAHSFRMKQQMLEDCPDECGMTPALIHNAMSWQRKTSQSTRDQKFQVAATHIQNKFRGWQGRKKFLNLRANTVKIQAHVRGHQVRKKHRFSKTVSILEKVILRWRRGGVGLRGFQIEPKAGNMDDNVDDDDEEILKIFRKQKVDGTVKAAVSRVLSMVESPEARQQYRRMLASYQQAKAESHDSDSLALDDSYLTDDTIDILYQMDDSLFS